MFLNDSLLPASSAGFFLQSDCRRRPGILLKPEALILGKSFSTSSRLETSIQTIIGFPKPSLFMGNLRDISNEDEAVRVSAWEFLWSDSKTTARSSICFEILAV